MAYLLDTNVLSEILKPKPNNGVVKWLGETDESTQYISTFTIGEIQKGIAKLTNSRRKTELQQWFDQVQKRYDSRVLPYAVETAKIWGVFMAKLESRGRPLSAIDSLIAAIAIERDLTIVTRNTIDFESAHVNVLNIWD